MSVYVKSYRLKRRVFSSFLKTRMSGSARMCSGNEFHAARLACEKARSPNLVHSYGGEKSIDDVDLGRWRRGSVFRASVFDWQTFPDLRLICG